MNSELSTASVSSTQASSTQASSTLLPPTNYINLDEVSKTIVFEMRRVLSYLIVILFMFGGFWILSKQTLNRQEEIIKKQEESIGMQKEIISNQSIIISRQKLVMKMQDEVIYPAAKIQEENHEEEKAAE